MNEIIRIKKDRQLAKTLMKIVADQKVNNAHIANSNQFLTLKEK